MEEHSEVRHTMPSATDLVSKIKATLRKKGYRKGGELAEGYVGDAIFSASTIGYLNGRESLMKEQEADRATTSPVPEVGENVIFIDLVRIGFGPTDFKMEEYPKTVLRKPKPHSRRLADAEHVLSLAVLSADGHAPVRVVNGVHQAGWGHFPCWRWKWEEGLDVRATR